MSLETFRTFPEDMRKLEQDIRHRLGIQKAHSRQGRDFCLLRSYTNPDLVQQHFVADSDTSEQFVFVKRRSTDTEQVFTVRGTLSEVALPPVRKPTAGRSINASSLYQFIKLTSYKTDNAFVDSARGIDNVLDMLTDAVPEHVDRRMIITPSGRVQFLSFKTPLLTAPHRVHPTDVIQVPEGIDPKGVLADGLRNGQFVMCKDNKVEFGRLTTDEAGEWHCTTGVTPTLFRPGTIVEAGVILRLLKLRNQSYKILFHLHSISTVTEEGPKILKEIRLRSKYYTPTPFPRKDTNFDGGMEDIIDGDEAGITDVDMVADVPLAGSAFMGDWNAPIFQIDGMPN
ncbi:hypothetical protein BDZ89DRAFT_1036740 [Hymenopellis radicata]|nr:hypothetical protein BDZ89DRAFT_1036740 [Hymenopellis radicata]